MVNEQTFLDFIVARHNIYLNRLAGKPKPWTDDPILQDYRFCNVYRELDTVTEWVHHNWLHPYHDEPDLWFAMAVARWVNWPDTLAAIGFPVPWDPMKFVRALAKRKAMGDKVWTGAYMIGTQGNAKDKPLFIADDVLSPLWKRRAELRPKAGMSLEDFARPIIKTKNQGTFMVGQIVADIKHVEPLLLADDWETWVVSGPGSRRGLNRVHGRSIKAGWSDDEFARHINELRIYVNNRLPNGWDTLDAQNLQNALCEYDKWCRVRNGEGRPRSRYPGRA